MKKNNKKLSGGQKGWGWMGFKGRPDFQIFFFFLLFLGGGTF